MEPQVYTTVEILDELARRVEEEPHDENSVKAMTSGILSRYFTPTSGFALTPPSNLDGQDADSMILHIRRFFPGGRGLEGCALVVASWGEDSITTSLEQIQDTLKKSNTEPNLRWVILMHGCVFHFYHYDPAQQAEERLTPWSRSGQQIAFHAKSDSGEIHQRMIQIAQ